MHLEDHLSEFELSTNQNNHVEEHSQALQAASYGWPKLADRGVATPQAMECFVAFQQGNQQGTTVNARWIRDHFNGPEQREMLDIINRYDISGVHIGDPGGDGNRQVRVNFDTQWNIPGVGDFNSLSGNLQITRTGFRITNPRRDGQPISVAGVNVTELEYNTDWYCQFCANGVIPLPGRDICSVIKRALRAL